MSFVPKKELAKGLNEEVKPKRLVCPRLFFCKHLSLVDNIVRLKNYGNGHILSLSVVLELKVENSKILTFQVIVPCQKSTESFSTFFSSKNT